MIGRPSYALMCARLGVSPIMPWLVLIDRRRGKGLLKAIKGSLALRIPVKNVILFGKLGQRASFGRESLDKSSVEVCET